ncbi:hypothetical protein TWF696_005627 [Orbilia brochopaga]|uniref:Uncharacterized protein n=1 Tax=Orbilia brochopaga TaxID=3140254 RepID=A0AAV9V3M1_9PEZI
MSGYVKDLHGPTIKKYHLNDLRVYHSRQRTKFAAMHGFVTDRVPQFHYERGSCGRDDFDDWHQACDLREELVEIRRRDMEKHLDLMERIAQRASDDNPRLRALRLPRARVAAAAALPPSSTPALS